MYNKTDNKTADIKFLELCGEIDYWKERTIKAEKNIEYWKDKYSKHINDRIKSAEKGVADAIVFALSVTDDMDGNLIINKENRKILEERFKSTDND